MSYTRRLNTFELSAKVDVDTVITFTKARTGRVRQLLRQRRLHGVHLGGNQGQSWSAKTKT